MRGAGEEKEAGQATRPNATYAPPKPRRTAPAGCSPRPPPSTGTPSAATSPPPPSTAPTSWSPSATLCSGGPGCPRTPHPPKPAPGAGHPPGSSRRVNTRGHHTTAVNVYPCSGIPQPGARRPRARPSRYPGPAPTPVPPSTLVVPWARTAARGHRVGMIAEGADVDEEPIVLAALADEFDLLHDGVLDAEDATPYFGVCHAVLPVGQWFWSTCNLAGGTACPRRYPCRTI